MPLRVFLACVVLSLGCSRCYGQAFIEGVFPPVVERGATTRVELVGNELETTHSLWTSLPAKVVKAARLIKDKEGNVLADIEVSSDAPLGIYGLRLATKDGLSNVHLFAIDDLPTTNERELELEDASNNRLADAQPIELPRSIVGVCRMSDIDHFSFQADKGQLLSFEVVASRLGKGFDPVLTILDDSGRYVMDRDNDVGLFFDSRFQFRFKKAGRYTIRLHDARYQGSDHWGYMLRIGRFPIARVAIPSTLPAGNNVTLSFPQLPDSPTAVQLPKTAVGTFFFDFRRPGDDASSWLPLTVSNLPNSMESEPNDKLPQATTTTVPANVHGHLGSANDWDWYQLDLKKGQAISLRAATREMGSPADVELAIYDASEKLLKQVDDVGFEDARFEFSAPEDGPYYLVVRDVVQHGGPAYVYRIEIRELQAELQLTSEIGRMAVPQDNWQPLPISVKRQRFSGPVELALLGAPEGMTLELGNLPADKNTTVSRLHVRSSVPAGLYTIQVTASAQASPELTLTAVATTHPLVDKVPTGRGPHGEPFDLREDQRRLPQSLTNRIAVLVTPPSPYNFEIATPEVALPRYLSTEFQLNVTSDDGLQQPIVFEARGGELEWDNLREPRVIATIPEVTGSQIGLIATLRSKVNTATLQQRVTVTATAQLPDRVVHLTRTLQLTIQEAFRPAGAEDKYEAVPGEVLTVRVDAHRLAPFGGEVRIAPQQHEQLPMPMSIVIPEGQSSVEIKIPVAADIKPGSYSLTMTGSARVAKFNEQAAGKLVIEIKPPAADKEAQ